MKAKEPLSEEEISRRLAEEDDFVNLSKFDYSIESLLKRYPDGAPDRFIAKGLCIPEEQVESIYRNVVVKLRSLMKVEDEED